MTAPARPILIVGVPRSGTSWTMRALGHGVGATTVLEPDSEDKWPAAIHAKRTLGRYPVLGPGDQAPAYRRLWSWTFGGAVEPRRSVLARHILGPGAEDRIYDGRPDPVTWLASTLARDPRPRPTAARGGQHTRIVAKSIHAQLAIEWIAAGFDIDVVLLLRHPANVLASWMEVNLKDSRYSTLQNRPEVRARYVEPWGVPLPGPEPVEQMSWMIGLLLAAIEDAASDIPTGTSAPMSSCAPIPPPSSGRWPKTSDWGGGRMPRTSSSGTTRRGPASPSNGWRPSSPIHGVTGSTTIRWPPCAGCSSGSRSRGGPTRTSSEAAPRRHRPSSALRTRARSRRRPPRAAAEVHQVSGPAQRDPLDHLHAGLGGQPSKAGPRSRGPLRRGRRIGACAGSASGRGTGTKRRRDRRPAPCVPAAWRARRHSRTRPERRRRRKRPPRSAVPIPAGSTWTSPGKAAACWAASATMASAGSMPVTWIPLAAKGANSGPLPHPTSRTRFAPRAAESRPPAATGRTAGPGRAPLPPARSSRRRRSGSPGAGSRSGSHRST